MSEDNNNTDGQDIQDKNAIIRMEDLYEACKLEVGKRNLSFAHIVKSNYRWDDLVLPLNTKEQLRDICNAIKHKRTVYESWGFEKRLSLGKGFNVLLSGPAGTGKTMGAEVIANELHLEMYKIDLSAIVSKWIGETERNLDKIFDYAREINVILFFDEADALFGKRTKVNDAHDRYANIETNYLLQKLEEYGGIVILSSNFRENIDDAFVRRLQHILEFRLPDENSRLEIWRNIFPKEAPISSDVNFMLLARKFKISGGSIKNVAVASAFLGSRRVFFPNLYETCIKSHET